MSLKSYEPGSSVLSISVLLIREMEVFSTMTLVELSVNRWYLSLPDLQRSYTDFSDITIAAWSTKELYWLHRHNGALVKCPRQGYRIYTCTVLLAIRSQTPVRVYLPSTGEQGLTQWEKDVSYICNVFSRWLRPHSAIYPVCNLRRICKPNVGWIGFV